MPIQEFKLLKNRNLLLFTIASSVSQLGDRINNMAILSLLGTYALGSQEYSLLAVWTVIPVLFFGPIAGAITDRSNRKALMIIGDFVRAFLVISLIFTFKLTRSFWVAYLTVFFVFTFTVLFNSAKNGLVVYIAGGKGNLPVLNSMLNFWGRISTGLGILLGGIISDRFLWEKYNLEGWEVGLFFDGLTFIISGLLIMFIKGKGEYIEPSSDAKINYISSLREGISFVRRRRILLSVLIAGALISFIGAVTYVLGIVKLQKIGHVGTAQMGIAGGIYGFGMFVGSYISGRVLKGREYGLLWNSVAILSFILTSISLTSNILILLPLFFVGGIFTSMGFIALETLFQKFSTAEYLGRVVILKDIVNAITFVFVVLAMGAWNDILSKYVGLEMALNINLLLSSALALLFWLLWKITRV